jgi:tetratricopeptide (TPR) repeat protein
MADEFARRAETLFRDYLKQNPGQDLVLAPFLAHVGKVGEALDLLEEKLEQTSAPDFALACSAIWQGGGKFTAGQAERLDGIVQKAVGRFERPVPLLSLLAEVRSRQGRYADTEAFYREVLKKQSGDAVTMNNLAVLLALEGVKLDEALRLMNQAVEIAGRVGAMLDSRASVYMAMNDPDNALSDIRAAVADAETPVRLFHLAQASKLAGQDKEARETMDKALKQGLTPDMLQPLELPAFEKMRQLPR